MKLTHIDPALKKKILTAEQAIGLVIYEQKFHWIIDMTNHFNLNEQLNIDALYEDKTLDRFLPKTVSSKEEWRDVITARYRSGLTILTHENFPTYRDSETAKIVDTEMLRNLLWAHQPQEYRPLSDSIQQFWTSGKTFTQREEDLRYEVFNMLPRFYINFDIRLFMHNVPERRFEEYVHGDWSGYNEDFEHRIPPAYRYWVGDPAIDLWATTNLAN